jgi:hypothetical protein
MVKRLGVQDLIHYTTISKYELDKNEPPLTICSPMLASQEFLNNH